MVQLHVHRNQPTSSRPQCTLTSTRGRADATPTSLPSRSPVEQTMIDHYLCIELFTCSHAGNNIIFFANIVQCNSILQLHIITSKVAMDRILCIHVHVIFDFAYYSACTKINLITILSYMCHHNCIMSALVAGAGG